jgi:hypothetical protein
LRAWARHIGADVVSPWRPHTEGLAIPFGLQPRGSRRIEHRWYEFGNADLKEGKLKFKPDSEARPFPVNAGSALSHETLFAAWENDCEQATEACEPAKNFVKWDDFITALSSSNQITITTGAQIYSKAPVEASCMVRLRDWEIEVLQKEHWLVATCADITARGDVQRRTKNLAIPHSGL